MTTRELLALCNGIKKDERDTKAASPALQKQHDHNCFEVG